MNKNDKNKGFTPLEVTEIGENKRANKSLTGFAPLEVMGAEKNNKADKLLTGFILVEILVTLVIFVIISITLGSVVVQMAKLQGTIMGRNQQISELRFALDYIFGAVANSQNPLMTGCIILANANFETIVGGIRFVNRDNRCQEIFLYPLVGEFRRIRTRISPNHTRANLDLATPIDLTSDIITSFSPKLMGNLIRPHDALQPRITISITSNIEGLDLPMTIQRSVSRIRLDN